MEGPSTEARYLASKVSPTLSSTRKRIWWVARPKTGQRTLRRSNPMKRSINGPGRPLSSVVSK